MRVFVKVKTGAKEEKAEQAQQAQDCFVVYVKEKPQKGKANEAVVRVLAKHFGVSKSSIKIISGLTSKNKVVETED